MFRASSLAWSSLLVCSGSIRISQRGLQGLIADEAATMEDCR